MQAIARINQILTASFRSDNNCHDVQLDWNPIRALTALSILLVVRLSSTLISMEDTLCNRFEVCGVTRYN
jgi:hypothetical protein